MNEIATRLPAWTVTGTAAGLHLVVHPSPQRDEAELAALARRCGLDARPLRQYAIALPDRVGLVIGYGHQRPDALTRSVTELTRALSRSGRSPGGMS